MAYGLKYTQYISKGNTTLRINVYAKDWTGATYGMAHITGASLQLIGGQSDITSPIIKTSFSWSMVDAWDQGGTRPDGTSCVNAADEKCGRWEEFYTNDATKFRVEVLNGSAVIWKGYVTPDSWSEEMQYRGSVTITARDMLGALQDAEFNLTGRVTVLQVIQGALAACGCPMTLTYTAAHFLTNEDGHSIIDHSFAASTFAGKTWYQALEDTLDSLGLVIRYNGAGQLILTSLRYLSADTLQGHHPVAYANRSGLRQLDPALKSVTEVFDADFEESQAGDPQTTQFSPAGGNLTQIVVAKLDGGATVTNTHYVPKYNLTQSGGEGWSGTLAVPQIGTAVDGAPDRTIYFPTDIQESVAATWYGPRLRGAFSFRFAMDGSMLELAGRSGQTILRPTYNPNRHFVDQITIRVEADVNGTVRYLSGTGSWETASGTLNVEPGTDVVVPDSGGIGIRIVVLSIRTANTLPAYNALFAPISLIATPAEGSGVVSEYKTTTNYDQENNVTITRSPVIGSADQEGSIDFFPNLLGYGNAIAPDKWNWPGQSSYYPLAVMIQAQILCFHAAAASVFTGNALDSAADIALPGYAFDYFNRRGIPVSGVYNLCSGITSQTIVREVYSWEEVWGTFEPEYTRVHSSTRGGTSAAASGGSSPGGSGGGASMAAVQAWVIEQGYATETWVGQQGYITGIDDDMIATALGYTPLGPTDLNGYATQTWVNNQHYLTAITATDIETALDYIPLGPDALNGYATQNWVGSQGYATQTWVQGRGYLTAIDDDMVITALGYTPVDPSDLTTYATKTWVQQQNYLQSITAADIETALDYVPLGPSSLDGYATQTWVNNQSFATQTWVQNRGYLTGIDDDMVISALGYTPLASADLSGYATQQWVNNQHYLTAITETDIETALDYVPLGPDDLNGYATQTWVGNQGYATQTWVNNKGYITGITSSMVTTALGYTPLQSSDLSGYATQTWVNNKGYITGITSAMVTTALGYTPLKSSDLSTYYHTGNANRTDTDWSCWILTCATDLQIGTSSDARLKEEVRTIPADHAAKVVAALRPVDFQWNDDAIRMDSRKAMRQHDVGFIAQEVRELIPDAVTDDYMDHLLRLDKTKIIPYLVAALQQLQGEVRKLKEDRK